MKNILYILGVFIAVVGVYGEMPEELKKTFNECKEELGMGNGKPDFDDPKTKCFYACVMKKKDELVDGKILPEKMIEAASKFFPDDSKLSDKINECASAADKESDECEVAAAMHKCFMEKFDLPHRPH